MLWVAARPSGLGRAFLFVIALTEAWAADYSAQESEFPTEFEFNGHTLTGTVGELIDSQEMRDSGYIDSQRRSLTVLLSRFTDLGLSVPVENDVITIGTTEFRIQSITTIDTVTADFALTKLI